ncbi:MAG: amidohydrolase family protein [Candidatus Moduliflexus flocculans]|nr:amidohydrolase family protein [Candidatus Moduliflexus flocculans]
MDEHLTQYVPGALAVRGDSIVAVGPEAEIKKEYTAAETIDCGGKVLMPGLVNAHTHVPMTLLRGIADDLRLDVWLQGYMWPVEREFVSPEFVSPGHLHRLRRTYPQRRDGIQRHVLLRGGGRQSHRPGRDARRLRAVRPQVPDRRREILRRRHGSRRATSSSAGRGTRSSSRPLRRTRPTPPPPTSCAKPPNSPANSTSRSTSTSPKPRSRSRTCAATNGMPVIPYVKKQGLFDAKVIAAHCVHIDAGEIRTLHHAGAGVSHNPSSNLKLASGFAPVTKMLAIGLNVGIGTDGPASNNDLDMFEEVRLAAFIAKAVSNDPTSLPASQALLMGTRLGAQALHIGHLTGSLDPGPPRRPDPARPQPRCTTPRASAAHPNNAYAQIVYASQVHGRERRDGQRQMGDARPRTAHPQRSGTARPGCRTSPRRSTPS